MIKRTKINNLLVLVFALYLNPIGFRFSPLICYAVLYGFALIYVLLNYPILRKYFLTLDYKSAALVFMCFAILLCSALIPFFHKTYDYTYIPIAVLIFRKLFLCAFLMVAVIRCHGSRIRIQMFMLYYAMGTCCYVIGSLLFFAIPHLKEYWMSILPEIPKGLTGSYGYATRFGWSGFSGYRNTADCTLSIIFANCIYHTKVEKQLTFFRYIFILSICILGNMFYGRMGLLVSSFCLLSSVLYYHEIRARHIFAAAFSVIVVFAVAYLLVRFVPGMNAWRRWLVVPFVNLFTTGHFNNASVNTLMNDMIFLPSLKTTLIGDGRYTEVTGSYYMHTDSGFMRIILFGGIGMAMLAYMTTLGAILGTYRRNWFFKLMMIAFFAAFEFKGDYYYDVLPVALIITMSRYHFKKETAPADFAWNDTVYG